MANLDDRALASNNVTWGKLSLDGRAMRGSDGTIRN
jgi:hypothetical protein